MIDAKKCALALSLTLAAVPGCGGGDDSGNGGGGTSSGGASGGGSGGTAAVSGVGGTTGSGGSSVGGSAGSGGSSVGGSAGSSGSNSGGANSGGSAGFGAAAGSGGSVGGSGGSGGFVFECNSATLSGDLITEVVVPGTAPAHQGGTIVDGTYVLSKVEAYGSASLYPVTRETLIVKAGKIEEVRQVYFDPSTSMFTEANYSYTVSGTVMQWTETCNNQGTSPVSFTATATELKLGQSLVSTYTKK